MTAASDAGLREFAALDHRVRECFFRVQDSWRSRDVRASRAFVSDALYRRHWSQLRR